MARSWLQRAGEDRRDGEKRELGVGRERGQPAKVLLGSLIEASPRALSLALLHSGHKEGIFHLFIQFHAMSTLSSGPRPSPKLPCLSGCPQSKTTSQRHCWEPVVVFLLCNKGSRAW